MWMTAFLLGLAGSMHCAGMCSPLAFAVTRLSKPVLVNRSLYNTGRIITYGLLGAIAGAVGGLFDFSSFQKFFSLIIGAGLVIMGVSGLKSFRIPVVTAAVVHLTGYIKTLFGTLLKKKNSLTILFLGSLNGLLPCGLTYMALAYSVTASGPAQGFLYMILFGAGTLPVMVGLPLLASPMMSRLAVGLPKINAALLIVTGLLLVVRNYVHLPMDVELPAAIQMVEPVCR
jgi:sulfite exporter TauE/SafE